MNHPHLQWLLFFRATSDDIKPKRGLKSACLLKLNRIDYSIIITALKSVLPNRWDPRLSFMINQLNVTYIIIIKRLTMSENAYLNLRFLLCKFRKFIWQPLIKDNFHSCVISYAYQTTTKQTFKNNDSSYELYTCFFFGGWEKILKSEILYCVRSWTTRWILKALNYVHSWEVMVSEN